MTENQKNTIKRKALFNDWGKVAVEILKWSFVIWLLWPLSRLSKEGMSHFTRVLLGILLFIIFSGKVFYDTIIMGFIKQRRMSMKQDVMMLLGMILVLCLVLGSVVILVGLYLSEVNDVLHPNG